MSLTSVDPLTGLDRDTTARLAEQDAAARAPAQRIGPHHCHAIGCRQVVPPEMLCCKAHWFALPANARKRVLAAYTPGQCDDVRRVKPAWIKAAREAIEILLQRELPTLIARLKLPDGYDPAQVKVERVGLSTVAIKQDGMPLLAASLASGEVRVVPEPPKADNDPSAEAETEKVQIGPLDV